MQAAWRETLTQANTAVLKAKGYTWRLFYNNATCAQAPFQKNECEEYMNIACSKEAPLEDNALFYGMYRISFLIYIYICLTLITPNISYPFCCSLFTNIYVLITFLINI